MVKGCYETAGLVKDDLMRIFTASESDIREGQPLNLVAENVLRERYKELNKRDYLRATLEGINEDSFTDFEKGILLLLTGRQTHAIKSNAGRLMLLHREITESKGFSDPHHKKLLEKYIEDAIYVNAESVFWIDKAWSQINQGYTHHLKQYLNT